MASSSGNPWCLSDLCVWRPFFVVTCVSIRADDVDVEHVSIHVPRAGTVNRGQLVERGRRVGPGGGRGDGGSASSASREPARRRPGRRLPTPLLHQTQLRKTGSSPRCRSASHPALPHRLPRKSVARSSPRARPGTTLPAPRPLETPGGETAAPGRLSSSAATPPASYHTTQRRNVRFAHPQHARRPPLRHPFRHRRIIHLLEPLHPYLFVASPNGSSSLLGDCSEPDRLCCNRTDYVLSTGFGLRSPKTQRTPGSAHTVAPLRPRPLCSGPVLVGCSPGGSQGWSRGCRAREGASAVKPPSR